LLVAEVRKDARRLLGQLRGRTADGEVGAYRDQVVAALRKLLRDLSGVRELFVDVGVAEPVDHAIEDVRFPDSPGRGERHVFGTHEQFLLRVTVRATNTVLTRPLKCLVGEKGPEEWKAPAGQKLRKDRSDQEEQEDEEEARARLVLTRVGLNVKPGPGEGRSEEFEFAIDCAKLGPGVHQVRVHLGGPDLNATNDQRFATFSVQVSRKILLVADKPEAAADWKKAIESRDDALLACEVKTPAEVEQLGADGLKDYQAAFLCHVKQPTDKLWGVLATYVQDNRPLGVLLGGVELDLKAYASPAAQALLPAVPKREVVKAEGVPWNWDDDAIYQHPLLRPVGVWRKNPPVDFLDEPPLAFRFWEVDLAAGADVLVRYAGDGKRPALVERRPNNRGRVVVLTTPADNRATPPWNDYMKSHTSFCVVLPGLWVRYFVRDLEEVRYNFVVRSRQWPVVSVPANSGYQLRGDLLAVQPAGKANPRPSLARNQIVGAKVFRDKGDRPEVTLPQAAQPGNYRLTEGGATVARFSVNMPKEECDLTRLPASDVEALFGPDCVVAVGQDVSWADAIRRQWGEPIELFPYLMIALLFLVALENLLANRFYRREPETQQ
jgi:hypothetical protein